MFEEIAPPDQKNLFPRKDADMAEILSWWRDAFISSQSARRQYQEKWRRFYRIYRMHVPRTPGDWRSKNVIPLVFSTIQSVLPKVVAQLPDPIVLPIGPQDEDAAPKMETVLRWASDQTQLQMRILEMFWSAFVYGTGVLKVTPEKYSVSRYAQKPVMRSLDFSGMVPVLDPDTGQPMTGVDGQPMMDNRTASLGQMPTGEMQTGMDTQTRYIGPCAKSVDIFDLYPAPEAADTNNARYIIHRSWMPREWVLARAKDKFYTLPNNMQDADLWSFDDNPKFQRLSDIGYGGSRADDRTAKMCQLWECWRDDGTVSTVLNERFLVRHVANPRHDGRMPFVRATDHFVPFEFWGMGEVETLEGLQDTMNVLWNSRIDNVKMVLNRMFMVDEQALVDPREITKARPGGFVRVNNPNGLPIQNIIAPIDFGEVTASAYKETEEIERMTEKVSGVSPITAGLNSDDLPPTATGMGLLSEAGNSRLTMKTRIAEISGLKDLMELYAKTLQQFTPPDLIMRITEGPTTTFEPVGQDVINGGFDLDIEAASSAISQSVRRQQDMSLLQMGANLIDPTTGAPIANLQALYEDLLRDFGKKDTSRYIFTPPPPPEQGPPGMAPPGAPGAQPQLPPDLAALAEQSVNRRVPAQ